MHRGYIKIWRKSLDSAVWKNADIWRFWCWCLMRATHVETDAVVGFQVVRLLPGQLVFGRRIAARETGLSERTIRTCLDFLKNSKKTTTRATNKFSILTIERWEDYQSCDQQATSKTTSRRPANDHIQEHQEQESKNKPTNPVPGSSDVLRKGAKDPKPNPCPPETWQRYLRISHGFHTDKAEHLGARAPYTEAKVTDGARVLDKLIRIDGRPEEEVIALLGWSTEDAFWRDQIRSIKGLLKVSKNGDTKYANALTAMHRDLERRVVSDG